MIEKYGSGIQRVIETFIAYGLPEPVYEVTQGGMAVTVFKVPVESKIKGVNGGVNGLLSYVQTHPGQRASEMAAALNLSQRTIERWLKQLKDTNKIEFRGAQKTGGYHKMTETKP